MKPPKNLKTLFKKNPAKKFISIEVRALVEINPAPTVQEMSLVLEALEVFTND
jgi:hypothetical protein